MKRYYPRFAMVTPFNLKVSDDSAMISVIATHSAPGALVDAYSHLIGLDNRRSTISTGLLANSYLSLVLRYLPLLARAMR